MKKEIQSLSPVGKVVFYRTQKRVEGNPEGDARHRASWRSPLERPTIPAGFLYGVDENGTIFDHSEIKFAVRNGTLLKKLEAVSSAPLDVEVEPEETLASVLAEAPGGIVHTVEVILEAFNMTPKALRELLRHKPVASRSNEPEIDVVAEL